MDPTEPAWRLRLEPGAGRGPVVVAQLGLRPPSRLTVRVTGAELLGEEGARILRLPPESPDIGVEIDASRLPDPLLVASSLRALRNRLQTGTAAPEPVARLRFGGRLED